MNVKIANRISNILIIFGGVLILSLCFVPEESTLFGIIMTFSAINIAAGIYINRKFYRCPHCQSYLSIRTFSVPDFCPFCGKKLDS